MKLVTKNSRTRRSRVRKASIAGMLVGGLIHSLIPTVAGGDTDWPQWRGPAGTGVSTTANPPTEWSETHHVRWRATLPGLGHSTPVTWGNRVFVTAAEPVGAAREPIYSQAPGAHDNAPITHRQRFWVMALRLDDGQVLWKRAVREALPHEGGHFTSSFASPSPVTDGQHVVASFGSQGIFCLDMQGQVVWSQQLGEMQTKHGHGEGSSPALGQDTVVVNWDHEGQSFIVALDKHTGRERWRKLRREVTSWSSPIIAQQDGHSQVIVCGTDRVRSYDLNRGDVIWECGGLSHNIVATPVAQDGLVIVGSSYEKRAMMAIRLDGARGDITGSQHILWQRSRATPYVPSPLLYNGNVYFLRHYQGILTRVDAKTGHELPGPLRLGPIRDVYASPIAAAGRVYVTDLDGTTVVMTADEIPRLVAINRLDDQFSASPVAVGDKLLLRGQRTLYCLSAEEQEGATSSPATPTP